MVAIINGVEFTLRDYDPFYYGDSVTLFVESESADDIVELIGDSATVSVPNEFTVTNVNLNTITRFWYNEKSYCEVSFKPFKYEERLQECTDYIEILSQAIEELAEIIGGNE